MPITENRIEEFLTKLKAQIETATVKKWPNCALNHMTIKWSKGPKYYRVTTTTLCGRHGSAFMFLDYDGNIYKPAGYRTPAKGIRGHIDTLPMEQMDGSGHFLYLR